MKAIAKACLTMLLVATAALTSCTTTQKVVRESNPNRKFTVENIPIHVRAVAEYIDPQGGPQFPLIGSDYFVEVLNDIAYVCLPYAGRVYSPTYVYDGTNFKEPYTNQKVERTPKDNGTVFKFTATHESIHYDFILTLWDGGHMDMSVTPNNAQTCRYSGTWDESQLYDKNGNPLDTKYY